MEYIGILKMNIIDTYIPFSIIGCPIEFSVSKKNVFLETDDPSNIRTWLVPGVVFTHPILGNMTLEFIEMNDETGHVTKVFCQLLDNKRRERKDVKM
jgi:hypothetical protein